MVLLLNAQFHSLVADLRLHLHLLRVDHLLHPRDLEMLILCLDTVLRPVLI